MKCKVSASTPRRFFIRIACPKCGGTGATGKRPPGRRGSPFDHRAKRGRCVECFGEGTIEIRYKDTTSMSAKRIHEAYNEGVTAREAGKLRKQNPYQRGSHTLWAAWDRGWRGLERR